MAKRQIAGVQVVMAPGRLYDVRSALAYFRGANAAPLDVAPHRVSRPKADEIQKLREEIEKLEREGGQFRRW